MKSLSHPVAAMVIFAFLAGIIVFIYSDMGTYYGITKNDTKTSAYTNQTGNIADQFNNLNLISGVNQITTSIGDIGTPNIGILDILGGLVSLGVGVIKTIIGIVTIPFEIVGIILEYYVEIPAIITYLCSIFVVYVGFILLRIYLNRGEL